MPNTQPKKNLMSLLKLLGPGLLFAGAAVGVSHLVLSTRAGAEYGYSLIWIVLLANVLKYPFFEFGPRYTAATGETILAGYQRLGNWVLVVFTIMTFVSMFAIQAAVTVVTAGLMTTFFNLGTYSSIIWSSILLVTCAIILLIGRYKVLDNVMKVVIIALTIASVASVIVAADKVAHIIEPQQVLPSSKAGLLLVIGLIGWMPGPIDISVWSSLWTQQKGKSEGKAITLKNAIFDFNVGYIGTAILAMCFLLLGAYVMYKSGTTFSPKGGVFAKQLVEMYTSTLGSWARPFIGIAAITTMFSTTFTCLDAMPRCMSKSTELLLEKTKKEYTPFRLYLIWLIVLIVGTLLILQFLIGNMGLMVKVATVLSFLTAPFFAIVNYILVTSKGFPEKSMPPQWIKILSWIGMLFLTLFSVSYIYFLLKG